MYNQNDFSKINENINPEQNEISRASTKGDFKRVPLTGAVIAAVLALVIGFTGSFYIFSIKNKELKSITDKLAQVDSLVRANYIGELSYEDIDNLVLSGYMYAIGDKYSFYQSGEGAKDVANSLKGDSLGIGVTVAYDKKNSGLYVIRIDSSGPAAEAGIIEKDIITEIDKKTVKELGFEKAVESIQRKVGQKVELTLLRDNKALTKTVTYKEFVRQSVYFRVIDNVGYIQFTGFNDATVEQFNFALEALQEKKVKGIIFDVRDNGGGTVDSVNEILDTLLPECDLMSVEYADGKRQVIHTSDEKEVELPFTVLVNGVTASAAELFAAAIRDTGKGSLIGETTFGKGVMQSTYFLQDDSCIRFTVGKFYPPSGVSFNEKGLSPDYKITYTEKEKAEIYRLGDKDPAIIKALEVLKND